MIDLRPIDPVASLGAILDFWNAHLGDRFPLDERLLAQQLRLERDETLCLAAYDPDKPDCPFVGLALVKRATRPNKDGVVPARGNVSFILVNERNRRHGIGSALLTAAERWLADRGVTTIRIGADTYHLLPGPPADQSPGSVALDAFLRAKGFSYEGDEHDMIADLGQLDLAALSRRAPMAPGFRFGFYEPALRSGVDSFFRSNFPGRWHQDTMEALDAGMRGTDLALLLEEATGNVVGFSRIYSGDSPVLGPGVYWRTLMGPAPCGLGPIGVDERKRGLGLGLALVRACIEELHNRGGRSMVIDWTDLVDFYAKLGFTVWKSYRLCSKKL